MSAADDRDDDLELGSLRAMLRSMPDEEPPARGLDALMAAARDKAAKMSATDTPETEPWWQRMFAVFRRPPVLALASVTVLIGGGLFLASRKDEMEAQPEVSVAQEPPTSAAAPASVTATMEPPAPPPAEPAADLATGAAPGAAPTATMEPPRRTPTGRREAISTKPRPKADRGAALGYGGESFNDGGGAASTAAPEAEEKPSSDGAMPATRRPQASPVERTSGTVPMTTLERLARQVERAAAKSDCPTVRSAMRQIAALDADKARALGNDPRIASCVNE